MEITLVVDLIGADKPTNTRDAFWGEYKRLRGQPTEKKPEELEAEVRSELPARLAKQIETYAREEVPGARDRLLRPRRRSPLDEKLLISVVSVKYGSMELLLKVLAGVGFQLSLADVVQLLHMFAPQAVSSVLGGGVALATNLGEPAGWLHGIGPDRNDGRAQASLARQAFYLANFSLLVPVVLSLLACYVAFQAMTDARRQLTSELTKVDSDRSELLHDAVGIIEDLRKGFAPADGAAAKPRARSGSDTSGFGEGPGPDITTDAPPPEPRWSLRAGGIVIFGSGPTIDFSDAAKALVTVAGPERVKEVIDGVGDGIDVLGKGVGLASDVLAFVRAWRNDADHPAASQPPLPAGTLLDRQVNFEFNSAALDDETRHELQLLAKTLAADHSTVLIEGHADGVGSPSYNMHLSEGRADAVKEYLERHDVDPSQLHSYGYGQGYFWLPFSPDDAANRRVRIMECVVAGVDRCASPQAAEKRSSSRPGAR